MTGTRLPDWTEDEIRLLEQLMKEGLTFGQIGIRMGRTRNSCIGKGRRQGFQQSPNPTNFTVKKAKKPASERRRTSYALANRVAKNKVAPTVLIPSLAAPQEPLDGKHITIIELRRDQCHAVMGSGRPAVGLASYCGHPAWQETAYCEGHYKAFHRPS